MADSKIGPRVAPSLPPQQPTEHPILNRAVGALQTVGGVIEMATGAGLILTPEPTMVTKVAGGAMAAHGADTFVAGVRTLVTGEVAHTATQALATEGAQAMGASEKVASAVGAGVDLAAGIGPAAALQIGRRAAIKAAEEAGTESVTVAAAAPQNGGRYGHSYVGVTEGGQNQYYHQAGRIDVPNGVRVSKTVPRRELVQKVTVAVSPAQAQQGTAAANAAIAAPAQTWKVLGPNCATTARGIAAEAGVHTPFWGVSPSVLPVAVKNGYGINAGVTGATEAAPKVVEAATNQPKKTGWKP